MKEKKKNTFEFPIMKVETFCPADIITTSSGGEDPLHGTDIEGEGGFFDGDD